MDTINLGPDDWHLVPDAVDAWLPACRKAAASLVAASLIPSSVPLLFFHCPVTGKTAAVGPSDASSSDMEEARSIIARYGLDPFNRTPDFDASPWVKVAVSDTVRRVGEALNFLPGTYFDGIPNHPSPLAATLTGGLVGAAGGYGAGRLVRWLLPKGYGSNLGRTGAILGGTLGAAPGAVWMADNEAEGLDPLHDNTLTEGKPGDAPRPRFNEWLASPPDPPSGTAIERKIRKTLEDMATAAGSVKKRASETGAPLPGQPGPFDVHIDSLGRTLWESGATPPQASLVLSTIAAAARTPAEREIPGYVTGAQLGNLAWNAAGDYGRGLLAGYAFNKIVGSPYSPPSFGAVAAGAGILARVAAGIIGA